jgi:hypothetical protein
MFTKPCRAGTPLPADGELATGRDPDVGQAGGFDARSALRADLGRVRAAPASAAEPP